MTHRPMIATALMAALAGLIYIIKELIELFTQEADAADKAAESTQRFTTASKGTSGSGSKSGSAELTRLAVTLEAIKCGLESRAQSSWISLLAVMCMTRTKAGRFPTTQTT